MSSPRSRPVRCALVAGVTLAGCAIAEVDTINDVTSAAACAPGSYTSYEDSGRYPSGSVEQFPWRGPERTYPGGIEDFRGYGTSLPKSVECAYTKHQRPHLDV